VIVEQLGSINGQVVDIVIDNSALGAGGNNQYGRYGSLVTVANQTTTPTKIMSMWVYNLARSNEMIQYPVDISAPLGTQDVYVLDSALLPIKEANKDDQYGVKLTVSGNGAIATIIKGFTPDSTLYSKTPDDNHRYVTLTDSDLPPELIETFIPVTCIGLNPDPYVVTAHTRSDSGGGNLQFVSGHGYFNIQTPGLVVVGPMNATKQSPITWELVQTGGYAYVDFNSTSGAFKVTGIAPDDKRTVTLRATIEKAAGTVTNKVDFVGEVEITLEYDNMIQSKPVTALTLKANQTHKIVDNTSYFDLRELATFTPDTGLNINGTPITKGDLEWYINGQRNTTGYIYTPETPGEGKVTVEAVLPGDKNGGTRLEATTTLKLERDVLVHIDY
jgi:hypothetical protein